MRRPPRRALPRGSFHTASTSIEGGPRLLPNLPFLRLVHLRGAYKGREVLLGRSQACQWQGRCNINSAEQGSRSSGVAQRETSGHLAPLACGGHALHAPQAAACAPLLH